MVNKRRLTPLQTRIIERLVRLLGDQDVSLKQLSALSRTGSVETVRPSLQSLEKIGIVESRTEGRAHERYYRLSLRGRELLQDPDHFDTGIAVLARAIRLELPPGPFFPTTISLASYLLMKDPIFTEQHFPIDPKGQLAFGLRFAARMLTAISNGHVIRPMTANRQRELTDEIIGEGPWMLEDEPGKHRNASREEVEALLSGKRDQHLHGKSRSNS